MGRKESNQTYKTKSLEHELLPKFHYFGEEYQFAIEFAFLISLKKRLFSTLTDGIDHISGRHAAHGAKWLSSFGIR